MSFPDGCGSRPVFPIVAPGRERRPSCIGRRKQRRQRPQAGRTAAHRSRIGGVPGAATIRSAREITATVMPNGPEEVPTLLLALAELRRAAWRYGRLAVQGLRPDPAVHEVRLGQARRRPRRAHRSARRGRLRRYGEAQGRQGDRRPDQQDHRPPRRGQRPEGRHRPGRLQRREQARRGQGDAGPALEAGGHLPRGSISAPTAPGATTCWATPTST